MTSEKKRKRSRSGSRERIGRQQESTTLQQHVSTDSPKLDRPHVSIDATLSTSGLPRPKKLTAKSAVRYRSKVIENEFGYSSQNNPFGDADLARTFVWKKKYDQLKAAGHYVKPTPEYYVQETHRKISEIQSVKKRREEREIEERLLDEQKQLMAREKEQEHYEEWVKKEEEFHREMAKKSVDIRIEQSREKPIDLLAKALRMVAGTQYEDTSLLDVPPHEMFNDLTSAEIEDAIEDINLQLMSLPAEKVPEIELYDIDENTSPRLFWNSVLVLANDALAKAKLRDLADQQRIQDGINDASRKGMTNVVLGLVGLVPNGSTTTKTGGVLERDEATGLPQCVAEQIDRLLSTKALNELLGLELEMDTFIKNEEGDVVYWESLMDKLPHYKARAVCLKVYLQGKEIAKQQKQARNEESLRALSEKTSAESVNATSGSSFISEVYSSEAIPYLGYEEENVGQYSPVLEPFEVQTDEQEGQGDIATLDDPVESVDGPTNDDSEVSESTTVLQHDSRIDRTAGMYSPRVRPLREFYTNLNDVVDSLYDKQQRQELKKKLLEEERKRRRDMMASDAVTKSGLSDSAANTSSSIFARRFDAFDKFVDDEKTAMRPDEAPMSEANEYFLQKAHFDWEDKFRPRKPRFFNRVKTGYEWNKYNQTHYDHDNPPPKSVQGYKFNIFYPDLIDKTKTPTWRIEKGSGDDDSSTCIIIFHAGPPYEDVAFKILNRQWELNVRRGYRNCFDRGILQLYFNFTRYRYRR